MGKASKYFPAVGSFGHKWYPEDIAGMLGLPYVGNIYYVDPTNGSDSASGKTKAAAVKTLAVAYDKCTTNKHDVVVIVPGGTGTGTGTVETAAITWSKSLTHLVGNASGWIAGRARVTTATASLTPFITLSGNGCIFKDVQFFMGTTTGLYLFKVTGDRNHFYNVHFAGIGDATAGDSAAAASLWLSGGDENYFGHCVVGLDTIARSTSNANLELDAASTRNTFEDCLFPAYADNAGALFVKIDASADIDRFVLFKNCMFVNAVGSAATTMTVGMDLHASAGGLVILQDSVFFGATDVADDFTNVRGNPANAAGYAANAAGTQALIGLGITAA